MTALAQQQLFQRIERIVDSVPKSVPSSRTTVYDSEAPLHIPLSGYLSRWTRYTAASNNEIVWALILVDRLCMTSNMVLTQVKFVRLLLPALLLVSKLTTDFPYTMAIYARIGGVTTCDLLRLERAFLRDVAWQFNVSRNDLDTYLTALTGAPLSL
eukprot:Hpha_TRINITY_DN15461_c2_g2::TRINITY_DN15461_c2_g2_i1::g.173700::m.173700